jgi:hypothetical protein
LKNRDPRQIFSAANRVFGDDRFMTRFISSPAASADDVLARFAAAVRRTLFFKSAVTWLSVWLFAWGAAVLTMRATGFGAPYALSIAALGGLGCVIAAAYDARRRRPSLGALRAVIDSESGAGGLVMAADAADIGDWRERTPRLTAPRVVWRGGRPGGLLALALAFFLTSAFVPVRTAPFAAERKLEIAQDVARLDAQVDALRNEGALEPEKAESLRERLNRLNEDASGRDPAKTLEELDQIADSVKRAAERMAESQTRAAERLAQTQALAQALAADAETFDAKRTAEAMETLAALMESNVRERAALAKRLSPELRAALASGALNRERLQELASALAKESGDIGKSLQRLHKAGLIDGKTLRAGERAGKKADGDGLADFLAKNGSTLSVKEGLERWGSGGVSRGRGDAPLSWNDEPPDMRAKFQEKTLPPAVASALRESQALGVSQAAPQSEGTAPARAGALAGAAAGGGSAATHAILPKHRTAVRKYFERTAAPSP